MLSTRVDLQPTLAREKNVPSHKLFTKKGKKIIRKYEIALVIEQTVEVQLAGWLPSLQLRCVKFVGARACGVIECPGREVKDYSQEKPWTSTMR